MQLGYIKLYRELTEKPIWLESTPEQKVILVTLLMMANHRQKEWEWKGEKYEVKPGQFITSLDSILEKCGKGITMQNVRTALKRFEKYEFLTNESTNKNRLITIVNWEFYQQNDNATNNQTNKQLTSNQQATNKQLTTNKNDNNDKNEKKSIYAEIIDYLNYHAGREFKHSTKKNKDLINARLNEGFTLDDFKLVIEYCCKEWKGKTFNNGKLGDEYLQPSTLFNNKFDERLNKAKLVVQNAKQEQEQTPVYKPIKIDLNAGED